MKNSYRFDLGKEGQWSNAFDVSFIKIRPVSYKEDSKMFITFPGMPPSHGGAAVLTKGINIPDAETAGCSTGQDFTILKIPCRADCVLMQDISMNLFIHRMLMPICA